LYWTLNSIGFVSRKGAKARRNAQAWQIRRKRNIDKEAIDYFFAPLRLCVKSAFA
jgi:hypothetical protein